MGPLGTAIVVVAVLGLGMWVAALLLVRALEAELTAMTAHSAAYHDRVDALRAKIAAVDDEEARMAEELEELLGAGTSGVRDVHRAISDIPFDLLDTLPATRVASGRVRDVHDRTTDGVYDALSVVNKAAGGIYKAWLRRRDQP